MFKKYMAAVGIWILIIPLAILNGGLREHVLIRLGQIALPLSGIILSVLIFSMAYCLIPKIRGCNRKDTILFGVLWFVLTNLFDLCMCISEGRGAMGFLQSYEVVSGNLWCMVVTSALVSPYVSFRLQQKRHS